MNGNVTDTSATTGSAVRCDICPHGCQLREGQLGACRARVARGDSVVAQNYGRITSLALDPIEKKPLAQFMPGSSVLSVGSYGCNLSCPFCQNARIAHAGADDVRWRMVQPSELVKRACELRDEGCAGLAYTYNEPLVGYEFVRDCAREARDAGLVNVLVSNGFVNEGPLAELAPFIDAANIDLKGFTQDFYRAVNGRLQTVLHAIEFLARNSVCHVEVTTLVVPGMNDSLEEIGALAQWLASIDPHIPLHLSRFFPCYRMADVQPTPRSCVLEAQKEARRYLRNVYVGNM